MTFMIFPGRGDDGDASGCLHGEYPVIYLSVWCVYEREGVIGGFFQAAMILDCPLWAASQLFSVEDR